MWPLHEVTWQIVKDSFLSVHQPTLASLRKPISFTFTSQSIMGFVRKNLSAVFALGFHMGSILILHSCCGSRVVSSRAVGVRWSSFCHSSLSPAATLGLPGHLPAFVAFCLVASPSLLCLVLSQSSETFEKQFFLGFICLLLAVSLCPISAQVQMGLSEWHHARNHSSVAGPLSLSQAYVDWLLIPLFLLKHCLLMSRKT